MLSSKTIKKRSKFYWHLLIGLIAELFDTNIPLIVTTAVGLVTVGAGLLYLYNRHLEQKRPTKWRKVGELSDLICFPIKSCGPIRVKEIECSVIGLHHGYLRDRIFMVVKTDGCFITARQYPKMVKIQPQFEEENDEVFMKLSAPGMMDIKVDVKRLVETPIGQASVWSQKVKSIDCGEELARWFSRYILSEDFGLRLMYYPLDYPTRDVRSKNKVFKTTIASDTGALHDATSFMLINESSIADLNTKIEEPVTPMQFRPNFVVKGPSSFEEDNWKWIKIGDETTFRNVKPCTRCVFTNVNPDTGVSNKEGQPLKKLNEYRKLPNCESSVMGIHMGIRENGIVRLGDPIFVEA